MYLCYVLCSPYTIVGRGLKGNRVKIPDSPAAVSFNKWGEPIIATVRVEWEGAQTGSESEDLQSVYFFTASRKGRKRTQNV